MASALNRDDPWRRVPWLLPAATALTLLSLMGFLKLLAGPPFVTPLPRAVEVDVVELAPIPRTPRPPLSPPSPSAAPPLALEPPPPPLPHSPLPPKPEPPVAQTLPPPSVTADPDPRLVSDIRPPPPPVARVKPPPPPPRAAPPQKSAPAPPAPAPSPPVATAPAPPSPASAAPSAVAPPSGGNTGARALYQPLPEIPEELRRRAMDLVAVARFHVATNGSAEVELIQPTPDGTLNRALLDTLKKWRFFPAMEGGQPLASTVDIRIPISVR